MATLWSDESSFHGDVVYQFLSVGIEIIHKGLLVYNLKLFNEPKRFIAGMKLVQKIP